MLEGQDLSTGTWTGVRNRALGEPHEAQKGQVQDPATNSGQWPIPLQAGNEGLESSPVQKDLVLEGKKLDMSQQSQNHSMVEVRGHPWASSAPAHVLKQVDAEKVVQDGIWEDF